jgi:hypothetical protein
MSGTIITKASIASFVGWKAILRAYEARRHNFLGLLFSFLPGIKRGREKEESGGGWVAWRRRTVV